MLAPISAASSTSETISAGCSGTLGVISLVGIMPVGVKLRMNLLFTLTPLNTFHAFPRSSRVYAANARSAAVVGTYVT